MNPTAQFLIALGQALSAMALYGSGHPSRTSARDRLRVALQSALQGALAAEGLRITFLEHDVIVGQAVLSDLRGWDWNGKFIRANVRRLEIDVLPSDADLDRWLADLHTRLTAPAGTVLPAFMEAGLRVGSIRLAADDDGAGVGDGDGDGDGATEGTVVDLVDALMASSLLEEVDCVRWIHEQAARSDRVPMAEVEAVVQGLAVAMQRDQGFVLPLLELKTLDQYTTTHSCNVAMLAMGLAEEVGLRSADVRAIGTAALLHDIGKVRVPLDVLVKPGKLTDVEYGEIKRHTVEGARMLGERGRGHALAAIVAYEHHVWHNDEGGYPAFHYPRRCHYASRLVHVCDLYDALSTDRPFRKAWPRMQTLALLSERRGIEIDPELVDALLRMLARCDERRQPIQETPVQSDWNAAVARAARQYD
jgi:putative nucleotidyltransferase with HDIG domain